MNEQDKQSWQDWAEKAVAAMAAQCDAGRKSTVGLGRLDPADQPLACPVCDHTDVQLAALLFTLSDGRLVYVDVTGLHVFENGRGVPFQHALTVTYRCDEGHIFYHHYRPVDRGTRVTGLAVTIKGPLAEEARPLWQPSPECKEDADG